MITRIGRARTNRAHRRCRSPWAVLIGLVVASPMGLVPRAAPAAASAGASTSGHHALGDYDGDGKADLAVFRPSSGTWFIRQSSTGTEVSVWWGTSGDVAAAADYDGDGKTDPAVFRPSNGHWYLHLSAGGDQTVHWGTQGDLAVPGDYDGDGKADLAVFRPSNGSWYLHLSGGGDEAVAWGTADDVPAPADYDGDGKVDPAVFRPSAGTWFVHGGSTVKWGVPGDIPVPGDYNGDGRAEPAVFRPFNGAWYVLGGPATSFGTQGDAPAPADYDGDAKTDLAVFRPRNGAWFVQGSGGATTASTFGTTGDIATPLPPAALGPQPSAVPPHPLDAQITVDTARAMSASVPLEGGTIDAQAADGSHYRLDIPPNALLAPTTVTVTPVASVSGTGVSGGQFFGVDIAPDGLRLLQPATLTFVPAGVAPTTPVHTFASQASGTEFHFSPLIADGTRFAASLYHFSGHLLRICQGDCTPRQPDETQPSDWENQIDNQAEGPIEIFRENPGDPTPLQVLGKLFTRYYQNVISPMLGRLETDCAFAQQDGQKNLQQVLGFGRQVGTMLTGDYQPMADAVLESVVRAAENCFREKARPCVNHDKQSQVAELGELRRQIGILRPADADNSEFDPMNPKYDCFPDEFRVDFTQTEHFMPFDYVMRGYGDFIAKKRSEPQHGFVYYDIQLPFTYHLVDYDYNMGRCSQHGAGGTFVVTAVRGGPDLGGANLMAWYEPDGTGYVYGHLQNAMSTGQFYTATTTCADPPSTGTGFRAFNFTLPLSYGNRGFPIGSYSDRVQREYDATWSFTPVVP